MLLRRRSPFIVAALLLLCFLAAACGASAQTKALRVSLVSLNAARDTTLALSKEHEKQLYDACNPPACTQEQGHAQVDAWRVKVDNVIVALDIGYRAIHDAALLADDKSVANAVAATAEAIEIAKKLKEFK
jgi:hypothetical protein